MVLRSLLKVLQQLFACVNNVPRGEDSAPPTFSGTPTEVSSVAGQVHT